MTYAVAALEVKRPSGTLTRVDKLTSATLELNASAIQGAVSSGWATGKPRTNSWTISVDAKDTADDAGLQAALTALKEGEVVEIEAVLGEGRRVSGKALVTTTGLSGAVSSAFGASLSFVGSGKLCGLYHDSYPDAPENLAVDSVDAGRVTLSWDEVAGVDGYYLYYGTRSGGYPKWAKIETGDLSDSSNPEWTLIILEPRKHWFVVTSYNQTGSCVIESAYSNEVSATPEPPSDLLIGLVSWWDLEEASGTRIDAHGDNDLTDSGTVGSATGKVGDAADFDRGSDENLTIGDGAQSGLDAGTSDFSASLWMRPDNYRPVGPGENYIICKGAQGASFTGWSLSLQSTSTSDGYPQANLADGATRLTAATAGEKAPADGSWYHLVMVIDRASDQLRLYMDTALIATASLEGFGGLLGSEDFLIGNTDHQTTQGFDGLVDSVGIWSRALNSSDISALYNSGNGLAYSDI